MLLALVELSLISDTLPGIYKLRHADDSLSAAHLILDDGVIVGVPNRGLIQDVRARCLPQLMALTERCELGDAQLDWRLAFPKMQRVVHRQDAGRGAYRYKDDWLLSSGNDFFGKARTSMSVADVGIERTRVRDDGPWALTDSLVAKSVPGPTLGSIVVHYNAHGGVLFTGRLAGYDSRAGKLSAFPLENQHSIKWHVQSLLDLADAPGTFDFEWLIPAQGEPVHYANAQDARQALRDLAERTRAFESMDEERIMDFEAEQAANDPGNGPTR